MGHSCIHGKGNPTRKKYDQEEIDREQYRKEKPPETCQLRRKIDTGILLLVYGLLLGSISFQWR